MSVVSPSIRFAENEYFKQLYGDVTIKATQPLIWNDTNHNLSVRSASGTLSGVLTAAAQTIGGSKTFSAIPACAVTASAANHLTNKGYVDDAVVRGISWQEQVISFYDFATPPEATAGDRYISSSTTGSFVANYIYQYSGSAWVEYEPSEGWTLYCAGGSTHADETITYTATHIWTNNGSSIVHQDLIGAGTLTHANIDSYLNQAVKSTSSPQFAGVSITNTTASTSNTTGALLVSGGIAAGGLGIYNGTNAGHLIEDTSGILNVTSTSGISLGTAVKSKAITMASNTDWISFPSGGFHNDICTLSAYGPGHIGLGANCYLSSTGAFASIDPAIAAMGIYVQKGQFAAVLTNAALSAHNTVFWVDSNGLNIRNVEAASATTASQINNDVTGNLWIDAKASNTYIAQNDILHIIGSGTSSINAPGSLQVAGSAGTGMSQYIGRALHMTIPSVSPSPLYISGFSIAAEYSTCATTIGTMSGVTTTSYGKLYNQASAYVYWNIDSTVMLPYTGTMSCYFTPGYTGAPAHAQYILSSYTSANNSMISVIHETNGQLYIYLYDSSHTAIAHYSVAWNQTNGTEYAIELNYKLNAGASNLVQLFVGGVSVLTGVPANYTRAQPTNLMIGSSDLAAFRYIQAWTTVQHTVGYTPTTTQFTEGAYLDIGTTSSIMRSGYPISISNTTASTSVTTGSLIASGGLGVGGAMYATNAVITSTVTSTSSSTGALIVNGGIGTGAISLHSNGSNNYTSLYNDAAGSFYIDSHSNDIYTTVNEVLHVIGGSDSNFVAPGSLEVSGSAGTGMSHYIGRALHMMLPATSPSPLYASGQSIAADYSLNGAIGTMTGVMKTKYGKLFCDSSSSLAWNIDATILLPYTGTISCYFTPGYAGTPSDTQYIMGAYVGTTNDSKLRVVHSTDGSLYVLVYDDTSTIYASYSAAWSPDNGTEYVIECDWNLNSGASNLVQVFVNGLSHVSGVPADHTRTQPTVFKIGPCDLASYRYIQAWSTVQHTVDYTPTTTQFAEGAYLDIGTTTSTMRCKYPMNITNTLSSYDLSIYNSSGKRAGLSTSSGGTLTINADGGKVDFYVSEVVTVQNTADSTSVTSGGLIVAGGLGVGKTLSVNNVNVTSTTLSTSTSTGAVVISGGLGVTGAICSPSIQTCAMEPPIPHAAGSTINASESFNSIVCFSSASGVLKLPAPGAMGTLLALYGVYTNGFKWQFRVLKTGSAGSMTLEGDSGWSLYGVTSVTSWAEVMCVVHNSAADEFDAYIIGV